MDQYLSAIDGVGRPPAGGTLRDTLSRIGESLENPKMRARVNCGVGRNMLAHTADGKLYPCHRYAGESAFEVGSLEGGLDRARLDRYYRDILSTYDKHCSRCWARNICGGQCAWYISRGDGSVGVPDEAGCNTLRSSFERQIWFFAEVQERSNAHLKEKKAEVERDEG